MPNVTPPTAAATAVRLWRGLDAVPVGDTVDDPAHRHDAMRYLCALLRAEHPGWERALILRPLLGDLVPAADRTAAPGPHDGPPPRTGPPVDTGPPTSTTGSSLARTLTVAANAPGARRVAA